MLDLCGDDNMLRLFKQICRKYYEIYPEMIVSEINGYRELYDSDSFEISMGMEKDDFVVAFYRNLRETWQEEGINRENALGSGTTKKLPRNYQENYQETTKKTTPIKKKTSEMIKDIMRDTPSTSADIIASQIGISADGVRYHIRNLKKTGDIERIGGDKGGVWKVNKGHIEHKGWLTRMIIRVSRRGICNLLYLTQFLTQRHRFLPNFDTTNP